MPRTIKTKPEIAKAIIKELTPKKIMDEANVSKSTVSSWKKNGMPLYFQKYLRARYPELQVWSEFHVCL